MNSIMRHRITVNPRDILFFRDARPMGGSFEGAGASWPLPGVFHSAMRSALLAEWPEGNPELESTDHRYSDREKRKGKDKSTTALFGGLQTVGPFPQTGDGDGDLLFPLPLDVEANSVMRPQPVSDFISNLPPPLKWPVANTCPPSKNELGNWLSLSELERYLQGKIQIETIANDRVFRTEARPGVGINPDTHANEQGIFYQAEYLRLRDNVAMAAFAECPGIKRGGEVAGYMLDAFFAKEHRRPLILGGQRGVAYFEARRNALTIAKPAIKGNCVKWVLLTPALFNAGWLPGWIDPRTGRVRLKGEPPSRRDFRGRREWREAIKNLPAIKATLIAARIGRPVVVSGWKLARVSHIDS